MLDDKEKEFFETNQALSTMLMQRAPLKVKEQLDEIRKALKSLPTSNEYDHLFIKEKDREYWFQLKHTIRIGRKQQNDLVLESPFISLVHCVIEKIENGWILEDLNSSNGLYVNNQKVGLHFLVDGDIIQLSHYKLFFFAKLDLNLDYEIL